jgi:hypothetical protein
MKPGVRLQDSARRVAPGSAATAGSAHEVSGDELFAAFPSRTGGVLGSRYS